MRCDLIQIPSKKGREKYKHLTESRQGSRLIKLSTQINNGDQPAKTPWDQFKARDNYLAADWLEGSHVIVTGQLIG